MKNNQNNSKNFEDYLKELENIVNEMESGNIPLNKALEMYERGINISNYCIKELEKAELKLKKLSKKINGSFEIEDID